MRCRRCQYELWDLNEPRCPECGRTFALDEWDFSRSDAVFACVACGHGLPGAPPTSTGPCPACGSAVDPRRVRVRRGPSGKDVPRVPTGRAMRNVRCGLTFVLLVSVLTVVLLSLDASVYSGRQLKPEPILTILAIAGILLGVFGSWPSRSGRRLVLVGSTLLVAIVMLVGSMVLHEHNRARRQLDLRQSTSLRGVAQAMMISMHQTGTLPADPRGLVDAGYVPPEFFYPRTNAPGLPTNATPLPGGWLTVGEMHVDWTPAAWNWNTPVVAMVYEHSLRRDGLLMARADGSTDWVAWADIPAAVSTANAERAAIGLPPIPPAVLPPP